LSPIRYPRPHVTVVTCGRGGRNDPGDRARSPAD
jgi:hypothetical protein